MYLSKLKLIGFKSFANRTVLEFNSGISCIIGPNGSGKSNIVDAVRWVLGEQRTSILRSDKMENVIFNGTNSRKPMGLAEVSMTIENNKGILKTEFDEVVIARRLYRSGESQYLINNTPVRLKDVLDIFMDSGLGANSYSVIELKMVENILSENKSERRLLFEEAAGVVKYKVRRKSALRKLEATRIDLTRINDIISEVQKKVNSLSRQVGKARRYLKYTEELKKADVDLARWRYHHLLDEIRPLSAQLKEISQLKEESHHQITIDEALLEDYKRDRVQTEQQLQAINKELHAFDQKVAQINQDQAIGRTKAEEMSKARDRFTQEIQDFHKKISILEENIKKYEAELDDLLAHKNLVDKRFAKIEGERKSEIEKLQKEKQEIDRLNQSFLARFQQVAGLKDELKQQKFQLKFQQEQRDALLKKIASFQKNQTALKAQQEKIHKAKEALLKERQESDGQLKRLEQNMEKLQKSLDQLQDELNRQNAELERIRSKKVFFEQIISNYEGHAKSTQYIMTRQKSLPGVYGPLSDLFTVDTAYSSAVEMLLGEALDYIVVDTVRKAKELIRSVEREDQGRVTLIPLERLDAISLPRMPSDPELTFLMDSLKTEDRYEKLIRIQLGDVAIANDLNHALELAAKHADIRFLTPQGDLVNFNREISSGKVNRNNASIIGRKERLQELAQSEKEQIRRVHKIQQRLASLQEDLETSLSEKHTITEHMNRSYHKIIEQEKQENQVLYEMKQIESGLLNEQTHLSRTEQKIKELSAESLKMSDRVIAEEKKLDELERRTIQQTSSYEQNSSMLDTLLNEVQKVRIDVTNLQNQITNRKNDRERTQHSIADLNNQIHKHHQEIERIEQALIQMGEDSKKRQEDLASLWKTRDELEDQQQKIEEQLHEIETKIQSTEDQTRQYRKQHDSSLEKSRTLELRINENRFKAEGLRESILKEYSEDIEIGIPYEGLDEQAVEEKIELLKQRIKNLGPVNPLAVSEYDTEKERFDFLTKQRDDLLKAEKSLLETINKINKTARDQFLDTFQSIKSNFEKVFRSFFENGEGTILLEEDDDPLEANIEIQVRTKGRKLQTLTLLSQGEKTLTAISLLFAIYLVKPSPFCIFDEVDAPLDDVNITRFNTALENFSKNTQFIVVTHNKRTMEAANTLYGVTMEEEGISKIVSVKFT